MDGEAHQFWTLPYVPGKRIARKPVYVLTGRQTFSSAEAYACVLRSLKHATLVGETTAGGAHAGGWEGQSAHLALFVPCGRFLDPVTGT